MALYDEILADVLGWTNKPAMVNETDMAIRQAVRTAHKSAKFWRDLVVQPVAGLSVTDQIQQVDLVSSCPRFRQLAYVKPTGEDRTYKAVEVLDLFDPDGYARTDVCYGIGNMLMIRPAAAVTDIEICYYAYPVVSPLSALSSWIAENHTDLIVLWAAATVLSLVGEQEIKTRVEGLAKLAYDDLIQDGLELQGR